MCHEKKHRATNRDTPHKTTGYIVASLSLSLPPLTRAPLEGLSNTITLSSPEVPSHAQRSQSTDTWPPSVYCPSTPTIAAAAPRNAPDRYTRREIRRPAAAAAAAPSLLRRNEVGCVISATSHRGFRRRLRPSLAFGSMITIVCACVYDFRQKICYRIPFFPDWSLMRCECGRPQPEEEHKHRASSSVSVDPRPRSNNFGGKAAGREPASEDELGSNIAMKALLLRAIIISRA